MNVCLCLNHSCSGFEGSGPGCNVCRLLRDRLRWLYSSTATFDFETFPMNELTPPVRMIPCKDLNSSECWHKTISLLTTSNQKGEFQISTICAICGSSCSYIFNWSATIPVQILHDVERVASLSEVECATCNGGRGRADL